MAPPRRTPYPPPDALVAFLPKPRDLALAREQRWYRIRAHRAPKALDTARWLAFYLPSSFGENRWAVSYVAPILGTEVATRRELLPMEPDHERAGQRYVRVRLGEVRELSRPIPSRRHRRILFIPTRLAKIEAAEEINDLFHDSPLEDALWHELRRTGIEAERQFHVPDGKVNYYLDFAVICQRGHLDVECDGDTWHSRVETISQDNDRNNRLAQLGWQVLRYNGSQLAEERIAKAVDEIRRAVTRLGGLEMPDVGQRVFAASGEPIDQLRLLGPPRR
jgi:very-short-patch-repair endonuclease